VSGTLAELETPCLIADAARVESNARRMRERASGFGLALRPHLKTTKSAAIARIAHGGEAGPGTVSTLREADYFLDNGIGDLTYAVCITPNKFAHAAALIDRGCDLKLLLASAAMAHALTEFAAAGTVPLKVMIEIDSGDHRTGFAPDDPELADAARILANGENVELVGLLTHGGHSYACRTPAAIVAVAEQERSALIRARDRLRSAGIEAGVLSAGSTPTAVLGKNFDELGEIRPGVYLAGDLYQAQLGSCLMDDIAVSVLASVIAQDPVRNQLVIDAGGLALSKDRSTADAPVDYGYGLVVDEQGRLPQGDLIVSGVSQEHGIVTSRAPVDFGAWPVGSRVRVLPNHVCMTAAAYDRYFVVEGEDSAIIDEWHKASGW